MIRALAASCCCCCCSCTGFRVRKTCRACLITIIKHLSCQINPLNENWLLLLLALNLGYLTGIGSGGCRLDAAGWWCQGGFEMNCFLLLPHAVGSGFLKMWWGWCRWATGNGGTDSETNWRFLVVDFLLPSRFWWKKEESNIDRQQEQIGLNLGFDFYDSILYVMVDQGKKGKGKWAILMQFPLKFFKNSSWRSPTMPPEFFQKLLEFIKNSSCDSERISPFGILRECLI